MSYTWGSKEFVKAIKELHVLIENETDLKRKLYLQKVSDSIDKIYHEAFNKISIPRATAKSGLTSISSSRLEYGRYYSLINSFLCSCSPYLELIYDISNRLDSLDENGNFDFLQTGATLSQDRILSLTGEFYKSLDDEIYESFVPVYNDRFGTLRFVDESSMKNSNSNGNTIFIDVIKKAFITIGESLPIETYACSVHEYGHAIHSAINPEVFYSDRNDFFMEVASMFFEILSVLESKDNFTDIEKSYYLYACCTSYIEFAELLSLHTPILNEWAANKYVMTKKFFSELEENYDINDEVFTNCLSTTIEDDGQYVLGIMVSLELLHIYKQDKRKALELLKGFMKYPAKEDILVYVIENFGTFENVGTEVGILIEDFDKKLTKRMS